MFGGEIPLSNEKKKFLESLMGNYLCREFKKKPFPCFHLSISSTHQWSTVPVKLPNENKSTLVTTPNEVDFL